MLVIRCQRGRGFAVVQSSRLWTGSIGPDIIYANTWCEFPIIRILYNQNEINTKSHDLTHLQKCKVIIPAAVGRIFIICFDIGRLLSKICSDLLVRSYLYQNVLGTKYIVSDTKADCVHIWLAEFTFYDEVLAQISVSF